MAGAADINRDGSENVSGEIDPGETQHLICGVKWIYDNLALMGATGFANPLIQVRARELILEDDGVGLGEVERGGEQGGEIERIAKKVFRGSSQKDYIL